MTPVSSARNPSSTPRPGAGRRAIELKPKDEARPEGRREPDEADTPGREPRHRGDQPRRGTDCRPRRPRPFRVTTREVGEPAPHQAHADRASEGGHDCAPY